MRFLDDNIRLIITDKENSTNSYKFKAYLEKSDVQVKIIDNNLQYTPIAYTNNTQFIKVQYTVDFSWNVFSEDRDEAINNYDQLHSLLQLIKPSYRFSNGQLLPNASNIFGLLSIRFAGLPQLSKVRKDYDLYVTNFSYEINKEMGYLEMPYDAYNTQSPDRNLLFVSGKNTLIPIAYKLNLAGRVLLPLSESIKAPGYTDKQIVSGNTLQTILSKSVGGDKDYQDKIYAIAVSLLGEEKIANLSESKQQAVFKLIKGGKDSFIVGLDGNVSNYDKEGNKYLGEGDTAQESSIGNPKPSTIKQSKINADYNNFKNELSSY